MKRLKTKTLVKIIWTFSKLIPKALESNRLSHSPLIRITNNPKVRFSHKGIYKSGVFSKEEKIIFNWAVSRIHCISSFWSKSKNRFLYHLPKMHVKSLRKIYFLRLSVISMIIILLTFSLFLVVQQRMILSWLNKMSCKVKKLITFHYNIINKNC